MRLDKALSSSGYGTRSEVRNLIAKGKVSVDKNIIRDPSYRINDDLIEVDGTRILYKEFIYIILDKPDSMLTAMTDKRLPHIGQLIPDAFKNRRISPVGRLDYHTTGLLLLTNDGEMSHRLTSPAFNVAKKYEVIYEGPSLTEQQIREAESGITLTDTDVPVRLKSARLEIIGNSKASITLTEGKTHEVRRIFAHWERPVQSLRRIGFGPLTLDEDTYEGSIRELSSDEVSALRLLTGLISKD